MSHFKNGKHNSGYANKINLPDFPNNKLVFLFGSTKRLANTLGQDSVYIFFGWMKAKGDEEWDTTIQPLLLVYKMQHKNNTCTI